MHALGSAVRPTMVQVKALFEVHGGESSGNWDTLGISNTPKHIFFMLKQAHRVRHEFLQFRKKICSFNFTAFFFFFFWYYFETFCTIFITKFIGFLFDCL